MLANEKEKENVYEYEVDDGDGDYDEDYQRSLEGKKKGFYRLKWLRQRCQQRS